MADRPAPLAELPILSLRGMKVLLSPDLAALYEVETKVLMQAVKRNIQRFPADFMFQLDDVEWENLRSQFVTSNRVCDLKPRWCPVCALRIHRTGRSHAF